MTAPLRRARQAVAILLLLGAAGCADLFTKTPLPLYRLTASGGVPAGLPHLSKQIIISTPDAAHGLDTSRIAISRPALAFDYLADGEWVDRAPAVVRTALIEGFENSHAVDGVERESFALRADLILDSELRHFEAAYDSPAANAKGPPTVEVTLAVKLVKIPEHTIVAQTVVSARQPAAANATPQIVAAFDAALADAVRQAVRWTVTSAVLPPRRR